MYGRNCSPSEMLGHSIFRYFNKSEQLIVVESSHRIKLHLVEEDGLIFPVDKIVPG
jgi:hypothetical protein